MKTIAISLLIFSLIGCNQIKENKAAQKDWEQIQNSKDTYDFSAFVIKHPISKHVGKAIKRHFFLRDSLYKPQTYFQDYYSRYVSLYCNKDTFFFDHKPVKTDSLKNKTYDYLIKIESEIPERKHIKDELERKIWNSYAFGRIAFLVDTVNVDITHYSKSFEQVAKGIQLYKKFLSEKFYETDISELDTIQNQTIESIASIKLEFWHEIMFEYAPPLIVPPPPPAPLP